MDRQPDSHLGAGLCTRCGRRTATVSVVNCPECGGAITAAAQADRPSQVGFLRMPPMRYQQGYVWLVFVSALDVMLTWTILRFGGREVNVLADAVVAHAGLSGIAVYKFCLVLFVIVMCEVIGRRNDKAGYNLAWVSVAISCVPVVLSLIQLLVAG